MSGYLSIGNFIFLALCDFEFLPSKLYLADVKPNLCSYFWSKRFVRAALTSVMQKKLFL